MSGPQFLRCYSLRTKFHKLNRRTVQSSPVVYVFKGKTLEILLLLDFLRERGNLCGVVSVLTRSLRSPPGVSKSRWCPFKGYDDGGSLTSKRGLSGSGVVRDGKSVHS